MIEQEFQDFLNAPIAEPSRAARERIFARVRSDLQPAVHTIFLKLLLLQITVGAATLAVCPQFGIGPIGGGHGILHFVMQYGRIVCASVCGSLFLGASAGISALALRPEELRIGRRHRLWQFSLIALVSALVLIGLGNQVGIASRDLDPLFMGFWLASGVLTATLIHAARLRWLDLAQQQV